VPSATNADSAENGSMLPNVSMSATKLSDNEHKCVTPSYEYSMFDVKRQRPLPLRRRIIEFYTAPITKFLANSVCLIKILLTIFCMII